MIVTLDNLDEIDKAIRMKLLDVNRYVCLVTEGSPLVDIVIQPVVTTKGRNTYILVKQPMSSVEKCKEIFGEIMPVRNITFRDDSFSF